MYKYYRGTTFQFAGQMQDDGVVLDLTGSTLLGSVFDPTGQTLIANLTVVVMVGTDGLVMITFPGDTTNWPVGKARIDWVLSLADGTNVASDPVPFIIAQTPMIVPS